MNKIDLIERHVCGSSRLGIVNETLDMSTSSAVDLDGYVLSEHFLNKKRYELSNHLGNVLSTISDYKKPNDVNADALVDFYNAQVISSQDYYPFGTPMKERTFSSAGYRYGFNGKENDNEVKGNGNQQDYGYRIYDPRLAKFLSVDPITKKYPMLSPYQFASNRPIDGIDQDGLEHQVKNVQLNKEGAIIKVTDVSDVLRDVGSQGWGIQYKYYQNGKVVQAAFVTSDPPLFFAGKGSDAPVYLKGKKIFEQGNLEGPDNSPFHSIEAGAKSTTKFTTKYGGIKETIKGSYTDNGSSKFDKTVSAETEIIKSGTGSNGFSQNFQLFVKGNLVRPIDDATKATFTLPLPSNLYINVTYRLNDQKAESFELGIGLKESKPDIEIKQKVTPLTVKP